MERIVVVGASLAGLRAVEALRRLGFEGRLTLVGDEPHAPYDRPPLSKQLLRGQWQPERLDLRRGAGLDALDLDLKLGLRAAALDANARRVQLEGGETLDYDGLLIASGCRARKLPFGHGLPGVHVLRTLDDALGLRAALTAAPGPRVCVIGAGFIGLEVAASCRELGLEVHAVEAAALPLAERLGEPVARAVLALHERRGVAMHLGVQVQGLEAEGALHRVRLSSGDVIECEQVVVGIGVKPAVDWLAGTGLDLQDGVLCDAKCMTALSNVAAAGDVARWYNRRYDETMRVEHWTQAVEQANHAAANLLAPAEERTDFAPVPYFWSDQYGLKLQFAGRARAGDAFSVVEGGLEPGEGEEFSRLVGTYRREGKLVGAVAFNRPVQLMGLRREMAAREG
ncbi:MAG: FAD-dependent oxidoreductase [Myxococcales bacterium]|nr:FAD-dependent oxidoreductase [Myxococcales bacterium]